MVQAGEDVDPCEDSSFRQSMVRSKTFQTAIKRSLTVWMMSQHELSTKRASPMYSSTTILVVSHRSRAGTACSCSVSILRGRCRGCGARLRMASVSSRNEKVQRSTVETVLCLQVAIVRFHVATSGPSSLLPRPPGNLKTLECVS